MSRPERVPGQPPHAFQAIKYLILFNFLPFLPAKIKHWVQIPALNPGQWGAMISRSTRFRSPLPVNRIRAARQALGWTQNELARKAGVSARTIHAIEKGRSCRQATKRSILNALAVPWEMRDEYFQRARSVRRVRPIETAHSA
jgi:DNA-binding XRE family transcriptional regulator